MNHLLPASLNPNPPPPTRPHRSRRNVAQASRLRVDRASRPVIRSLRRAEAEFPLSSSTEREHP
jgi:hypothetical protein